ncbi:hypothetical protein Ancab_005437 [Ancistrocladus abbreviatus]
MSHGHATVLAIVECNCTFNFHENRPFFLKQILRFNSMPSGFISSTKSSARAVAVKHQEKGKMIREPFFLA